MRRSVIGVAALLAGCDQLPEGVKLDIGNGSVTVGHCTCTLPPSSQPVSGNGQQPR